MRTELNSLPVGVRNVAQLDVAAIERQRLRADQLRRPALQAGCRVVVGDVIAVIALADNVLVLSVAPSCASDSLSVNVVPVVLPAS